MKLRESILTRKQFLNGLLGGWLAALGATLLYPVLRFIKPPYREPEEVLLPLSSYENMALYAAHSFAWGNKPGILIRKSDSFEAFVGVCTHLDCNVTWIPDQRRFFCACHKGWFDEAGVNIAGPPPAPLRQLVVRIQGDQIQIRREGTES